ADREVCASWIGFPQDAYVVLLAGGKIFFRVDTNDVVHLLLKWLPRVGVFTRGGADIRDPKLPRHTDQLNEIIVVASALFRVGIDVVLRCLKCGSGNTRLR